MPNLNNPGNDAKMIAGNLLKLGFEVTVQEDLARREMWRTFVQFSEKLERKGKNAVGLIYFAGHGLGWDAANYLIPVDAQIRKFSEIPNEGYNVSDLSKLLARANNQLNIMVFDSCRNNPFDTTQRSLPRRGLLEMGTVSGMFIASSTASGSEAFDGDRGGNSPYSLALSKAMMTPGLNLEGVFKRVRRNVRIKTLNQQLPWVSSSLEVDFYFIAPDPNKAAQSNHEILLEEAKSARNPTLFELIITRFPSTRSAGKAQMLLKEIREEQSRKKYLIDARAEYAIARQWQLAVAFEEIARKYPDTIYGHQARKETKRLRQLDIDKKTSSKIDGAHLLQRARKAGTIAAYALVVRIATDHETVRIARREMRARDTNKNLASRIDPAKELYERALKTRSPQALGLVNQLFPQSRWAKQALVEIDKLPDGNKSIPHLSGRDLVSSLQEELVRRSCLKVPSSGVFDRRTVAGLRQFTKVSYDPYYWHRPTMAALRALRTAPYEVHCQKKDVKRQVTTERCVKINNDRFCP